MPNWCFNRLEVTGSENELKKFSDKAKLMYKNVEGQKEKTEISLQNFLPLPEELVGTTAPNKDKNTELIKKYGADNWYDWQVKNWGTKWDIIATLSKQVKGKLVFHFDSAWSPPCPAFVHISKMFPKLKFVLEYEEGGMGYYGRLISKDGLHHDECLNMRFGFCKTCKENQPLTWDNNCPECGDIINQEDKPKHIRKDRR